MLTDDQRTFLTAALEQTYFKDAPPEYRDTEAYQRDVWDHVEGRYTHFAKDVLPWLRRHVDISNHIVVEIGAGTGSSTAAISPFVKEVITFDIDRKSVEAAGSRAEILDYKNANQMASEFTESAASSLQPFDGVFLAAVLEHCTFKECTALLRAAWNRLKPGGWLCVIDTPNRFCPIDHHTSYLPFFASLPIEIRIDYASRSTRHAFANDLLHSQIRDATEKMTRWGAGISYHEFELAISPEFSRYIIADGWEPEINAAINILPEDLYVELALKTFAPEVSRAFARRTFYFIAQKPFG